MVSTGLSGFFEILQNVRENVRIFWIFHQNVKNCQDFQLFITIFLVTYIIKSLVTNFLIPIETALKSFERLKQPKLS